MPVYLFWGDEDFKIDEEVIKLKKTVLNNEITPLNYRKTENPNYTKLDEILRSQAMMFGNILYVISANKYFINDSKATILTDKETDDIIKSIENLADSIHIAFVCKIEPNVNKKVDSRKKLYKAVAKFGTVCHFETFKPWEEYKATSWILEQAKKMKVKISQSSASKLVQTTGMSLRALNNNLEKLALLSHPKNIITDDMIDSICKDTEDMFSISNLIIKGEFSKALFEISKVLEKQNFLIVLAFLQSSIMKFLQTKLYENDYLPIKIGKITGQHEFVVKQNIQKLQNTSLKELIRIKQNLTRIEYKLKTGEIQDPILAFELAFTGDCK